MVHVTSSLAREAVKVTSLVSVSQIIHISGQSRSFDGSSVMDLDSHDGFTMCMPRTCSS